MRTMMKTKQVRNRLARKVRLIQLKEIIIWIFDSISANHRQDSKIASLLNGTLGGLIDMIDWRSKVAESSCDGYVAFNFL